MSIVIDEISDIFIGMGYEIVDGPEVRWTTTTLRRSISPRTIPRRMSRTRFISTATYF